MKKSTHNFWTLLELELKSFFPLYCRLAFFYALKHLNVLLYQFYVDLAARLLVQYMIQFDRQVCSAPILDVSVLVVCIWVGDCLFYRSIQIFIYDPKVWRSYFKFFLAKTRAEMKSSWKPLDLDVWVCMVYVPIERERLRSPIRGKFLWFERNSNQEKERNAKLIEFIWDAVHVH